MLIGILLALFCRSFAADAWTHFRPEAVLSTDCRVIKVLVYGGDGKFESEVYQAVASAKRKLDTPDDLWEMEIARFPITQKGHRKAAIACSDWSDEADKRIKAAQLSKGEK